MTWMLYTPGPDGRADLARPHACTAPQPAAHEPEPEPEPDLDLDLDLAAEPAPAPAPSPASDLARMLAAAVAPYVAGKVDETRVREIVAEQIARADVGVKTLRLEMPQPSGDIVRIDGAHAQLPELLYWLGARDVNGYRHAVLLFGKPGTSKSHSAHQAADALALSFGLISLNPQTPESRLFGYKDAGGSYHRTVFRDAYEHGGLYLIDEIDNASDSLLTSLNSALANGSGAFPDGMVQRHADFVCIATANTPGRGGDANHAGRRPLDAATINRFVVIEWRNDDELEARLVNAINPKGAPWLAWVRKVRAYCDQHHPRVIVSPRSSMMGARALVDSPFTVEQIADQTLFKGLDRDTRAKILTACPLPEASSRAAGKVA
jgi:cobaltochelatase CobS